MTKQCFTLSLEPIPGDRRTPAQRLRGLLKSALRRHGLRCLDVRTCDDTEPTSRTNHDET